MLIEKIIFESINHQIYFSFLLFFVFKLFLSKYLVLQLKINSGLWLENHQ